MKVGMGAVERIGQSREAIGGQCREQPAAVAKVVRRRGMRDTRFAGQLHGDNSVAPRRATMSAALVSIAARRSPW